MITTNGAPEHPVVSSNCIEAEKNVLRHVYPLRLTRENLLTFWDKQRQFRTLFTDEINGNFQSFAEMFISVEGSEIQSRGLFWVIDDFVGIFYMTHITMREASCHFTFFDRRLHGRERLTQEMLSFVFDRFNFHRLNVELPLYASRHTFAFVERIGFVREGRKRSALRYKNKWFDVLCYGLLREETESWAQSLKQ